MPDAGPNSQPAFADWLTKHQVAAVLGLSTKSVESIAKAGSIQSQRTQSNGTNRWIVVYHPGDVERVRLARSGRNTAAFVVPGKETSALATSANGSQQRLIADIDRMWAAFATAANSQKPVAQKLFLTIQEASDYSGLPKAVLITMIRETLKGMRLEPGRALPARKTGAGWRVRRADLEELL